MTNRQMVNYNWKVYVYLAACLIGSALAIAFIIHALMIPSNDPNINWRHN